MPRERADSDYCLLVQPAVIGLQSVDCYCQPKMEFTNASAPFCLLCAATDSCNAIGARIESCVVRHYGLDVSAIQQEVREWDALVKGVLEAKKEEMVFLGEGVAPCTSYSIEPSFTMSPSLFIFTMSVLFFCWPTNAVARMSSDPRR